jgi:sigma-E factor negative regulatory protein RseA
MTTSGQVESQVSAFVDGEVDKGELSLLIKRMANDSELRQRWDDYHLIGDTLKKQLPEQLDSGFALRVSQAIAEEPELVRSAPSSTVKKQFAGMAVAASVAMVAVLGVMNMVNQAPTSPGQMMAQNAPVTSSTPPSLQSQAVTSLASADVNAPRDPRLNKYLVKHSEYAVNASLHGVFPYARVVGQEVRK